MRVSILAAGILAGAFALGVTGAQAAAGGSGPNGNTVHADCGAGTFDVAINGHAHNFAAAHIVDGGTFVPTSFGETTVVVTDANGTVTNVEPPVSKGSSAHNGGDLTCTYEFTITDHGATVDISGTVTGFITPANTR